MNLQKLCYFSPALQFLIIATWFLSIRLLEKQKDSVSWPECPGSQFSHVPFAALQIN